MNNASLVHPVLGPAEAGVSSRVRHSLVGLWQAWKVDLEGKGMQWSTVCLV